MNVKRLPLVIEVAILLTLLCGVCTAHAATSPVVRTTGGPVAGVRTAGLDVFRAIPYAAPPVGSRRFKPPVAPRPWREVRPARKPGPACIQTPAYDPTENGNHVQSEDCLTLNVWAPRGSTAKRPVLVWIHGGAFVEGSARNSWFDGAALARRGNAVVVTIQYRLGIFGFSELSQRDRSFAGGGNAGMLDQLAALRWVQDNIGRFGGDRHNVTIFGESAGGEAIHLLMGLKRARGLFQRAIIQSGILAGAASPKKDSVAQSDLMLKAAHARTVAALQAIPAHKLQTIADNAGVFQWPHLDGVTFTRSADAAIQAGQGVKVPLLIGTNLDEMRYWTAMCAAPGDASVSPASVSKHVFGNTTMLRQYFGARCPDVVATYRRDFADEEEAVTTFLGDGNFRISAIRLAEAQRRFAPVNMYLFAYRSPVKGRTGKVYGAPHSMELPFVFGLRAKAAVPVTGPTSRWGDLQERTMDAWSAFARTGDPSTPTLPWPRYDQVRRATMVLDARSAVVDDPFAEERRAWDEAPAALLPWPIPFSV